MTQSKHPRHNVKGNLFNPSINRGEGRLSMIRETGDNAQLRQQLDADVQAFLNAGGAIEQGPPLGDDRSHRPVRVHQTGSFD